MFRLFEGSSHAELYKKYRRTTPKFLVDKIVQWMGPNTTSAYQVAVDVGCGSGQHTMTLAPFFEKVYGFDVSDAQIAEAQRHHGSHLPGNPGNVVFEVASADHLPLPDHSAQLVTGCFSFHWFDLDKFYEEVDRVLVPGGVIAAVGHTLMRVVDPVNGDAIKHLMDDFVANTLSAKMYERNELAFNAYKELPLPYSEVLRIQNLGLEIRRTLDDVLGAYSSWSSFQLLLKEDPVQLMASVNQFREQFLRILDLDPSTPSDEVPLVFHYDYYVAMCRKPGPVL